MKKTALISILTLSIFSITAISKAFMEPKFYEAIATCEEYSKQGSIEHKNETFNILVTLNKKGNKCVYKEKIYQDKDYQMLTCNFDDKQLNFLSNSMKNFTNTFPAQIAKNNIFEAKMTTNGEIFQKYLIDPQYCQITHSKKK